MTFSPTGKEENNSQLSIWIPQSAEAWLCDTAEKLNTSRADVARQAILYAIENRDHIEDIKNENNG